MSTYVLIGILASLKMVLELQEKRYAGHTLHLGNQVHLFIYLTTNQSFMEP